MLSPSPGIQLQEVPVDNMQSPFATSVTYALPDAIASDDEEAEKFMRYGDTFALVKPPKFKTTFFTISARYKHLLQFAEFRNFQFKTRKTSLGEYFTMSLFSAVFQSLKEKSCFVGSQ